MALARINAFMMSLLSRQYALMGDAFLTRYAHPWLVWEPGQTAVPRAGVDVSIAETSVPLEQQTGPRPLAGDALCFALKVTDGAVLRLGRAAENELVISDLTVSRLHAQLEKKGESWSLASVGQSVVRVGGTAISAGSPIPLSSGAVVELAGVKLAFLDATAFRDRVASTPMPGR